MVDEQVVGADGLLDEMAALPQSHPGEVQQRQIDLPAADEVGQPRVRHGAVAGDQDPEAAGLQDAAVVGDLPVLGALMGQLEEVHPQIPDGQMTAGTRQADLAVKLLLRQYQDGRRVPGHHLLRQGAGIVVRMTVGVEQDLRPGKVRMGLEDAPELGGHGGEADDAAVVQRVGPDAVLAEVQGDPGIDTEGDLTAGHGRAPCVYR